LIRHLPPVSPELAQNAPQPSAIRGADEKELRIR
jgi:hypothetical protein